MTSKERTRLTEHFADWEFRCRCGCGSMWVDWSLLEALEGLRAVHELPLHIISGCRCRRHNRTVGGTPKSRHLTESNGQPIPNTAADIYIAGMSVRSMFKAARSVNRFSEGGIGVYPGEGFVHVDVRHGKARWARLVKGGKYVQIPRNLY